MAVFVNQGCHAFIHHVREHGYLGVKSGTQGVPELLYILVENRIPMSLGCICQSFSMLAVKYRIRQNIKIRVTGPKRNKIKRIFHKTKQGFVKTMLDTRRPIISIVISAS